MKTFVKDLATKALLQEIERGECFVVKRTALEFLANFRCDHTHKLDDGETCFDHPNQGACCNSCWVRSWAGKVISGERKQNTPSMGAMTEVECPVCDKRRSLRIDELPKDPPECVCGELMLPTEESCKRMFGE